MAKVADRYFEVDPWAIIETGFNASKGRVSESIFSLGNEYMGVRGYFDEGYSGDRLVGSYMNGIFEEAEIQHPNKAKGIATRTRFMVNTVDWFYTRIRIDDELLDMAQSNITSFERKLDLRDGVLTREFVWTTSKGKSLKITFKRFLSMVNTKLGFQRIAIEPLNFSGHIDIEAGLDFSPEHEAEGRNFWSCNEKGESYGITAILGRTETSRQYVFSSFKLDFGSEVHTELINTEKSVIRHFQLDLNKGKETTFDKLVFNMKDKRINVDANEVWNKGIEEAGKNFTVTFDKALEEHTSYWNEVWDKLDITIEGDPENQQGIRYCIFQLHQTYHGQDAFNNVGAKGLTGEAYSGHTFWDTETYCLPFYIFNNPKAARNLLEYRYRTLPQAIEWAKEQDCTGACYPMSTIDGTESCGVWWHGNLEIHVSAAVAYGIWHYDKLCRDKDFLYNMGGEMLIQISRFFASRIDRDPVSGEYGFYGVMGPDEFHTFVNNNCYTNYLVKKVFLFTNSIIEKMKTEVPKQFEKLLERIKFDKSEQEAWKNMAQNMIIPYDSETGLYEQHDGYFSLPHLDINSIPVEQFPLYDSWCLVRIYRYDMIKQPDVLLFMLFFSSEFSRDIKLANYKYYEPRCIHESSLSPSVHSILASELELHNEAYDFFRFATRMDLDNYNRNSGQGLHITSIAAAWMNIVYGFGGMRSDGDSLVFNPSIPKQWNSYSFRVLYGNSLISMEINKDSIFARVASGTPVTLKIFESFYNIDDKGTKINTIIK